MATKPSTTIRLSEEQYAQLDELTEKTELNRSALISLAINSFVDHVTRTGKLPLARARRKQGGAAHG